MKELSTDLDRKTFESKDDIAFTRFFWPNLFLAIGIGCFSVIGILFLAVNADVIDSFFSEIIKKLFI